MLRDFKFLRRNSGKHVDEVENVPVNPKDSLAGPQIGTDSASRPPLNTIQEPFQSQEASVRASKIDRTPTKPKAVTTIPLRTPEKQGKTRFGWAQKSDSSTSAVELKDEGRVDASENVSQLRAAMNTATPRSTRTDARRANSGYSGCNSTQSTPTKSVNKPPNPGFCLASGSRPPAIGGARMSNFAALSKGIPISSNSFTVVNTIEVPHFELKEDPSFWLEHNVQVLIRIRPLNNAEKSAHGYGRCLKQESAQCVTWIGQPETRFTFDHVACETIDQETLFRMVGLPMVENCLSGYNSCMFAYGQTGSGKTHTMLGDIQELEIRPSSNRGMTPRIFEFLFARIRAEEESRKDDKLRYHCKCSFLEIYNEQITDLLDPLSTNLLLREDIKKGVHVENLTEFEVQTVGDILKLLRQGSSNRKVAATNMNRESSRSHSVFTCVIESRWEKDSTSNFRFARLNLVDLAGSERQKTSGAEGERLKEAANINKSLSTLGHVIMVLVDVANGRPRHVPYRDSRLTFLLQDSLGGNSKTMIIANISPSICCAAETLNTLKFAQRAKLIQNNAIVNEDSSGDVIALHNQIRLLKEELSLLKCQNVSRSLAFGPASTLDHEDYNSCSEEALDRQAHCQGIECKGTLRLSTKQLKSLETILAGALRREKMGETSIKQLEAEIEQLNRLVHQREEDTRSTKMMLKFREDKIQRMESLLGGLVPDDAYLLEENGALSDEIQLLQAKIEKNPEVTRFALENIRLLEQLRRYQDFYEEGEREMLMAEVAELRDQLIHFLDGNLKQPNQLDVNLDHEGINASKENDSLRLELKSTLSELDECRSNLSLYVEYNAKLSRDIEDMRASLNGGTSVTLDYESNIEVIKEPISEAAPSSNDQVLAAAQKEKRDMWHENINKHTLEVMDLQLEVDILKIILKEERSFRVEADERAQALYRDLELSKKKLVLITEQYEGVQEELKEAQSIIEALESQQILSINEIEDLKNSNSHYAELIQMQELQLSSLKEQTHSQEFKNLSFVKHKEGEDSVLQEKLNRMHNSLEKAKKLNKRYQSDRAFQASNEEEMDEVRRQVEAETAEVIVCLQEELSRLHHEAEARNLTQMETEASLEHSQTEIQLLGEKLCLMTQDNKNLYVMLENKERELRKLSEEWELLTSDIEAVLVGGHESLKDASDQLNIISSSFPRKRNWISAQFGRMTKHIFDKDLLIEELNGCLEDAVGKRNDLECMLRSLKGAALVMTEAHQQECSEKDKEIILLTSQLTAEASTSLDLKNKINRGEDQLRQASTCATVAFVLVNRLSELSSEHLDALKRMDVQLVEFEEKNMSKDIIIQNQASVIEEAEKQNQSLRKDLEVLEESCGGLRMKLLEEQNSANAMRHELEEYEENDILRTGEKLAELTNGVSAVRSCMKAYSEGIQSSVLDGPIGNSAGSLSGEKEDIWTGTKRREVSNCMKLPESSSNIEKNFNDHLSNQKNLTCLRSLKDVKNRDATIILLKKEIESALESLKGVQAEMAKLHDEKEKFWMSKKENERSIESVLSQLVVLQNAIGCFEEAFKSKMDTVDIKLRGFEEIVQYSSISWLQQKELLEAEVGDAKVIAVQKATEASCILAKFEEVQDTMKEADIMINELLIANEILKLDIKELKKKEVASMDDRNILMNKVQTLESMNELKDLHSRELEQRSESDFLSIKEAVHELEDMVSHIQMTSIKDCMSLASDCLAMKSELHDSFKLMKSCLEDVWSEIVIKDSAISVLHVCHIGILLETLTGLNAENSFLCYGISESNAVISELREHNSKSRRELERCRSLEGKLLADIKNSFDRIARQEGETGELSVKLTSFEQKILDLQFQEELMLQRSNYMGSELTVLMKDLDLSNRNVLASLQDQERLLKEKEEFFKSEEENFIMELSAKDFELFILSSELKKVSKFKEDMEKSQINTSEVIEILKKDTILQTIDARLSERILHEKETEFSFLQNKFENTERELHKRNSMIAQMDVSYKSLLLDIQPLKESASLSEALKSKSCGLMEEKTIISMQAEKLKAEYEKSLEDKKRMEVALEFSSAHISTLEQENQKLQKDICLLETTSCQLQDEMEMKDSELRKLSCLEEENKALQCDLGKMKEKFYVLLQDLEDKKAQFQSSLRDRDALDAENLTLRDKISAMDNHISNMQTHLYTAKAELNELQLSQSVAKDELCSNCQDLQIQVDRVNVLQEENTFLKDELRACLNEKHEHLSVLDLNIGKCVKTVESVRAAGGNMCTFFSEETSLLENMFQEICTEFGMIASFLDEFKCIEKLAKELTSETASLQTDLLRKDDILNGVLFDMSLLQESASNSKDQKDETESLLVSLGALESQLKLKSDSLGEAVSKSEKLEAQLQEKINIISALELDIAKEREIMRSLSSENLELIVSRKYAIEDRKSMEEELIDKSKVCEDLENEIAEIGIALAEMNNAFESLKSNLNDVSDERDELQDKVAILKKELEMEQTITEENGSLLAEAQEVAETRKLQVEDKEEEVKLLERSVEELERTVNVLENKVEILKGEAERQRLQREELEIELHAVKQQMQNVKSCDADMKRQLIEKEKSFQENLQRVQILEREIAARDAEITRCKYHISELNLHAEAQASEYKQKFKALEAMVEQVKQDAPATNGFNSSANKLEKNSSKSRGSGSPFKCIGLGLVQQMKSEKEEELSAGRHRIDELEALAASRQKEIFMLNARLATAESMTHDVIRDLLGIKLDMNSCATLFDNQQVQMLTEKAQLQNAEAQVKEQELVKLKQQLNEFIKERKGWLAEIDRKQAEMVAAQVALEKLRQRDQLLTAENDMLKVGNINHKKRVMELETEVKKLSGQQNIQQRIHHHAKIKEENNLLKSQNDELSMKLRKSEAFIIRAKEELAQYRTANGRSPVINFDEEQRLCHKLKETETERLQLAQELVSLCTCILKAAGITRPASEISPSVAEEALEQLKNRIHTLERELQDVKLKNRMNNERIRLSELMPETSPLSSRADQSHQPQNRVAQTPFLSSFDR